MAQEFKELYEAVIKGDATTAKSETEKALANKTNPQDLLTKTLIPAMDEVGRRFEANEFYIPELLIAGRAMKGAMKLLKPLLIKSGVKPAGHVIIGTIKGDLHDIGKNLVASMLEGGGFEVTDLGVDVAPEAFLSAVKEHKPDVLAMSALLTTTMQGMETTIKALEEAGIRSDVKVMIGGAPITEAYSNEIGSDGYSNNANAAVTLARTLVGAK